MTTQATYPPDGYNYEICGLCNGLGKGPELPCLPCNGTGKLLVHQPTRPEALATMRSNGLDGVLVVDGDRLVGIFTERDALLKLAGRPLAGISVRDVMTPDPVVLRADDSVAVAINKMAVGGFRHIPLVEDGHPTGIVTARDVFHRIAEIVG